MKILYASYRYDPTNPDLGSSLDYECYNAFMREGHKVEVVGPLSAPTNIFERIEIKLWQVYKRIIGKSGLKFPIATAIRASKMLRQAVQKTNPDVIFSVFPPFFVFGRSPVPCVWYLDTTFLGQENEWPLYGKLALKLSIWEEKKAFNYVQKIITMSEWLKQEIIDDYGIDSKKIKIAPLAATLPKSMTTFEDMSILTKILEQPIKLLLVGRIFTRKGIDIGIDIVVQLNQSGLPAELVVCGLNERQVESEFVKFVGPYKKSDPDQIKQYVELYKNAHLLIHPARFEAGGIVLSEAAAFGTPSVTNNTGGLATTVKDGVSGIVLPKGSPASAYVSAIIELVNDPERYHLLCRTTRERYEKELNWDVVGKQLVAILENAAREYQAGQGDHDK